MTGQQRLLDTGTRTPNHGANQDRVGARRGASDGPRAFSNTLVWALSRRIDAEQAEPTRGPLALSRLILRSCGLTTPDVFELRAKLINDVAKIVLLDHTQRIPTI